MKQFSAKIWCIFATLHGVQTHKLRSSPGLTTAGRFWPEGNNTLDVFDHRLQRHAVYFVQRSGAALFVRSVLSNRLLLCLRSAVRAHLSFLLTASPVPQNCTSVRKSPQTQRKYTGQFCSQLNGCVCSCSEFCSSYGYCRMRNCDLYRSVGVVR